MDCQFRVCKIKLRPCLILVYFYSLNEGKSTQFEKKNAKNVQKRAAKRNMVKKLAKSSKNVQLK